MNSILAKTIKERKKDQEQVREKAFREMKKDVGMTTAQKSKETRRMEMGSIFVLYIQPTIRQVASDYSVVMYVYVGLLAGYTVDPISILLVSLLF